jgi:hypothetical protein
MDGAVLIAEAFSTHRFEETYEHLSDDIIWNMVGSEQIHGRDKVMDRCARSAGYLAGVTTTFHKCRSLTGENCVAVETLAEYAEETAEGPASVIASCDIYDFVDGKIGQITSYVSELAAPSA